ncbi:type II toxin-antitoxin system PemK/MazF family toxin [Streptosporangium sp. NPDC051022]|uniref:type II toxin-antitoxin system PemK/MazF family toxin n=1 Tax=Streptosporangium sp. NPDC051022 TaxID=3155752 RepID=UPI0034237547
MRGDVYRLRAPRDAMGHEQRGERFAVILQSDFLNRLSTVLIAPTSASAPPAPFRPEVDLLGKQTRIMVEQTMAVAPHRLGDFAGRLDPAEIEEMDEALHTVFGLLN